MPAKLETNEDAKVWRFHTYEAAAEYAMFLDGHWQNVIAHESFDRRFPDRTWVVIAWHAG